VGASGSGKSTIAQLIPRFYDIAAGRIEIDGQDIRDVTLSSLRRAVSLVQQDFFLFDMTIHENISYAYPESPDTDVASAAKAAQLHEYVEKLPNAYNTRTGERGVSLSGGQRQRLAIGRGIVGDPAILIFDDSTSAIDAATELRVRAALKDVSSKRATIIISHRLKSLMHADEIIVLDAGHIVERGSHDELIARNGAYAVLYRMQSSVPREGGVPVMSAEGAATL
jgi:ATP-binding cassette subfamily B protein